MTGLSLDPALAWALRLALAGVWGMAAFHKASDPRGFQAAVAGYRLVPVRGVGAVAWTLGSCEAVLALGLLLPSTAVPAALASAALLALYAGAMAVNLARGRRDFDCGCSAAGKARPVGEGLLVRNGLLVALSLLAALEPGTRAWVWIDGITVAAGAATVLVLHAGVEVALANAPRSRLLGRRAWLTR